MQLYSSRNDQYKIPVKQRHTVTTVCPGLFESPLCLTAALHKAKSLQKLKNSNVIQALFDTALVACILGFQSSWTAGMKYWLSQQIGHYRSAPGSCLTRMGFNSYSSASYFVSAHCLTMGLYSSISVHVNRLRNGPVRKCITGTAIKWFTSSEFLHLCLPIYSMKSLYRTACNGYMAKIQHAIYRKKISSNSDKYKSFLREKSGLFMV